MAFLSAVFLPEPMSRLNFLEKVASTKGCTSKFHLTEFFQGIPKSSYAAIMRPLERDGGRRLEDFSGSLWFAQDAVFVTTR